MKDLISLENVIIISIAWIVLTVVYFLKKKKNEEAPGDVDMSVIDSGKGVNINISYDNEADIGEDETADMVVSVSELKSANYKAPDHIRENTNKDKGNKSVKIKLYTGSNIEKMIDVEKLKP